MSEYHCRLCDRPTRVLFRDGKDFFVNNGVSADFTVHQCDACGVAFTEPPLSHEELSRYYPETYEAYVAKKSVCALLQAAKYRQDLRLITKHTRPDSRRIFEIGAGRGEFLHFARKTGFAVSGIEPSPTGREHALRTYGIALEGGFGDSYKFTSKHDIVVARHVLEHIDDFAGCLTNIIENGLLPGGLLFLKLPRLDSWEARAFGRLWSGFDLPRHRGHFTRRGIRDVLARAGFAEISLRQEVVPTDLARSIGYYGRFQRAGVPAALCRWLSACPVFARYALCQSIGCLMAPFHAGRTIVLGYGGR